MQSLHPQRLCAPQSRPHHRVDARRYEEGRRRGLVLHGTPCPRTARAFVRKWCVEWRAPQADDAALIVSELVTNAWFHAVSPVGIVIAQAGTRVIISVTDSGPGPSRPRDAAESGRGLVVVHRLATRWGSLPAAGGGTCVWAHLAPEAPQ